MSKTSHNTGARAAAMIRGELGELESKLPPAEPGELRGPMEGVPLPSEAHKMTPLTLQLLQGLEARGDDIAFVYPRAGVQWTAAVLRTRAQHLAQSLVALGVQSGDRISLVGGTHPEYPPLFLATLLAGAAWSPLNHKFDDGDFRRLLDIIEPRVVFAPPAVFSRLQPLFDALRAEAEEEKGKGNVRKVPVLMAVGEGPEWEAFSRPLDNPPPLPPPPADSLTAPALIFCSSGTSGLPKGVIISHFNITACFNIIRHKRAVPKLDCTMVITSPGFWVTGIYYTLLAMVMPLKLVNEHGCNEKELLASVHNHKPAILFTGTNFVLPVAKMHEANPQHDLSSLRTIIPTGAAMSREAEEIVERSMKCTVQQVYGMTELGVAFGLTEHHLRKTGSVGTLSAFIQCKVVDIDTEGTLSANERGELRFKGPTITKGYMKNPEATANLFDDKGWLRSGDMGYFDEDGFFFVTGRIKDTIKYLGDHVSPVEIEGELDQHPAVLESAVVGVPGPNEWELPRAYVVLRSGAAVSAEELCSIVQEKLAPHKWLRGGVVFLDALPKASTGKISRAAIRKTFVENVGVCS